MSSGSVWSRDTDVSREERVGEQVEGAGCGGGGDVYGRGRCVRVQVRVRVSYGLADVVWDGVKWVLREAQIVRRWLVGRWFASVVGGRG